MADTTLELRSPTGRLIGGLALTLLLIGAFAAYTLRSVHQMRDMQSSIVERNRLASLQLIRIQNDLNSLSLAMRDMLDNRDNYPISAWRPALDRIHHNLDDAIEREAALTASRTPQQTAYLRTTFDGFWNLTTSMFHQPDAAARLTVRDTLQPRQQALSAFVARLLVENNQRESQASQDIQNIYAGIERNAWLLLAVSVALIGLTSFSLIRHNRRVFSHLSRLADERRTLAQQLITTQESTLRSLSRDLHDEFGQILTAIGALLGRARRHAPESSFQREVEEINIITQSTLDKVRTLSQSLQPVILEEQGLLAAVEWHLDTFSRHTGITVHSHLPTQSIELPTQQAIHVYRILQEALNNVARHAGATSVDVTLATTSRSLSLTITDSGAGFPAMPHPGVGLAAMRERAALLSGRLTIGPNHPTGTTVAFEVQHG